MSHVYPRFANRRFEDRESLSNGHIMLPCRRQQHMNRYAEVFPSRSTLRIAKCFLNKLHKRCHSLLLFVVLFSSPVALEHPQSIIVALLRRPLMSGVIKSASPATASPTSASEASLATSTSAWLIALLRLDGRGVDAL